MESILSSALFYLFALLAVLFAVLTVTTQRILRAAVCLMAVLLITAALYVLLGAEFLAGIQVLVYVGGIVVVLVFAVMLTHSVDLIETKPAASRKFFAFLAALSFFAISLYSYSQVSWAARVKAEDMLQAAPQIGRLLLSSGSQGYLIPFELISLLLLAAVIGGIVIARKNPSEEEKGGQA